MKIIVLGAGMMGKALAYDLGKYSNFDRIVIADKEKNKLQYLKKSINFGNFDTQFIDLEKTNQIKDIFQKYDIAISAVPYKYNFILAKIAIDTNTHFLDLGGNNDIVNKERNLFESAKRNRVTIIHDCGLAPGLSSVIVRDVVEQMDSIDFVKIRVGGLPVNPKPPLNYQIVFSPNGLINEYIEDAIILENHKIIVKKSMTEIERIDFPKPYENMEAFLTSGGCSTLPYTYQNKIRNLDYKTVRYPGHCNKFKLLLDLGLGSEKPVIVKGKKIIPRDLIIAFLIKHLPANERDVVLLKVISSGVKNRKKINLEYTMIDYFDEKNNITSMMRTTSYPTSIIAQLIEQEIINERGVFGCEEIVPCTPFFKELKKRDIIIHKDIK